MEHINGYDIVESCPTAVTIGNFDGLHLGHRRLIDITMKEAKEKGLKSIVFTFKPHPMFLLRNKPHSALIMAPEEKLYSMERIGIDSYIEYPFTLEFASMEPEAFINDIIFEKLNCKVLIVGENYRFGAKQKGDKELLQKLCDIKGVKLILVPPVMYDGQRVSSTRIRGCLLERNIELANNLMDNPYFILGTVTEGKKLGRTLGFPTTNVLADPVKLFPPNGVYATKTVCDGDIYYGVTNVGMNPTVCGDHKVVETYIFDFHKFVYGQRIKTYFFSWIRDERKFPDVEALQEQLRNDAQSALDYFKSDKTKHWLEEY